jgi:hypothetical protein
MLCDSPIALNYEFTRGNDTTKNSPKCLFCEASKTAELLQLSAGCVCIPCVDVSVEIVTGLASRGANS